MGAKKKNAKRQWGAPPKSGENKFVISTKDSRKYCGKIVVVAGWPDLGQYAKVIMAGNTVERVRKELCLSRDRATVHIIPGTDVICYINLALKEPQIERKERNS